MCVRPPAVCASSVLSFSHGTMASRPGRVSLLWRCWLNSCHSNGLNTRADCPPKVLNVTSFLLSETQTGCSSQERLRLVTL